MALEVSARLLRQLAAVPRQSSSDVKMHHHTLPSMLQHTPRWWHAVAARWQEYVDQYASRLNDQVEQAGGVVPYLHAAFAQYERTLHPVRVQWYVLFYFWAGCVTPWSWPVVSSATRIVEMLLTSLLWLVHLGAMVGYMGISIQAIHQCRVSRQPWIHLAWDLGFTASGCVFWWLVMLPAVHWCVLALLKGWLAIHAWRFLSWAMITHQSWFGGSGWNLTADHLAMAWFACLLFMQQVSVPMAFVAIAARVYAAMHEVHLE